MLCRNLREAERVNAVKYLLYSRDRDLQIYFKNFSIITGRYDLN